MALSLQKIPEDLRHQFLAFYQQRSNAIHHRKILWDLTFDQWWSIWQDSGRWEQRGRGSEKYCMCRNGDAGHYEVGNVYIATNAVNVASIARDKLLPIGVRSQRGKFYATRSIKNISYHIGTFSTPELAREAYLNFSI